MSTKAKVKSGDPRKRAEARVPAWIPLQRMDPADAAATTRQAAENRGYAPHIVAAAMDEAGAMETWTNSRYRVVVYRKDDAVRALQVMSTGGSQPPWPDLQRVKNELAGPEAEAYELFPAESRLIDAGPVSWLFVMPAGERAPGGICQHATGSFPGRRPIIDGDIPDGYVEALRAVK